MSQQPPYNGYQQGYQQPPAQPGYGYQQPPVQPGYGYQQPYYGYRPPAEHPQAQTVLILGILGFFTGVCAFIAWYMGAQARKEIAAGAPYPWAGSLKTGHLLGKVFGIIILVSVGISVVLPLLYGLLMLVIFGAFM